jgi:hypothetical protein
LGFPTAADDGFTIQPGKAADGAGKDCGRPAAGADPRQTARIATGGRESQQAVAEKFADCCVDIERAVSMLAATPPPPQIARTVSAPSSSMPATAGPDPLMVHMVRAPALALQPRLILLLDPELRQHHREAATWADCVLCLAHEPAHEPAIFKAAARIVEH